MCRVKHTLRGSTLVETLVMMLVAGIVFLSVMDGLTLFTRLHVRRTEALMAAGRSVEGYYRTEALVASADSAGSYGGDVELFWAGRRSVLALRDSALLYLDGEFRDTLLTRVGSLRLAEFDLRPDTVEVGFGARFSVRFFVRFSVKPAADRVYEQTMDELEFGYGYQE